VTARVELSRKTMAGDPESPIAVKVKANTNGRVLKICGVVFLLACVSTIAYGRMDGSSADGRRRLQDTCPTDEKSCPGGYALMRDPASNCQFPPCPGGGGGSPAIGPAFAAVPPSSSGGDTPTLGFASTTDHPQNVGAIVGGTLAGAAVVGGAVAGGVYLSQHPEQMTQVSLPNVSLPPVSFLPVSVPTVFLPPLKPLDTGNMTTFKKYEKTDPTKPAKAPGSMTQGMLMGGASLCLFAVAFLGVTGFMYMYKRNCSDQADGQGAGPQRNTFTPLAESEYGEDECGEE